MIELRATSGSSIDDDMFKHGGDALALLVERQCVPLFVDSGVQRRCL